MDYKGVEFQVVQASNPCRWKWTAFLDAIRMQSGVALTRADAALDAELAIEAALERREQSIKMGWEAEVHLDDQPLTKLMRRAERVKRMVRSL
jgi:hypothetical protein